MPPVIVALGVTAARSLLERVQSVDAMRRQAWPHGSGAWLYVTYHPSVILRTHADSVRLRDVLVGDLRRAHLEFTRLAGGGT